jgi:ATP-binding cassette subfamily F protein uup
MAGSRTGKSLRSALVIVSHDRRFLADLTRATVWLDRGTTRRLDRGFSAFEEWRDTVLEEEELARHKLDRQIVREEHWLPTASPRGASATSAGSAKATAQQRRRERAAARGVGNVSISRPRPIRRASW